MTISKNMGMRLLGIWLIVTGILQISGAGLLTLQTILAALAIVAGVLILAGR